MKAADIRAVKLLNLQGRPAVHIRVKTGNNEAWAAANSNLAAIANFNNTAKKLTNFNFQGFSDLQKIENLFGTKNSVTVALEYALLRALSSEREKPLWKILNPNAKKTPRIIANVLSTQHQLDIQEILISPRTKNISDSAFSTAEFYNVFRHLQLQTDKAALEFADRLASRHSTNIELGADFAAHSMVAGGKYLWKNYSHRHKGLHASEEKQIEIVENFANAHNLFYIEDPLHKEAYRGFATLRKLLCNYASRLVCGEHLVANIDKLKIAASQKSVNAAVINIDKLGSLIAAKQAFDFAKKKGLVPVLSSSDISATHLAVAWQAPFLKLDAADSTKLNELVKIEKLL